MYGKLTVKPRRHSQVERAALLQYCDIEPEHRWRYLTFLFEQVSQPRNTVEHRVKAHYAHCYQQCKHLGLTADDYVACGVNKQVFRLQDTVEPSVVKLFMDQHKYQAEQRHYEEIKNRYSDYLLAHAYEPWLARCSFLDTLGPSSDVGSLKKAVHTVRTQCDPTDPMVKKFLDYVEPRVTEGCRDRPDMGNFATQDGKLLLCDVGDILAFEWVL